MRPFSLPARSFAMILLLLPGATIAEVPGSGRVTGADAGLPADSILVSRADSALEALVADGFAGSVLVARRGDILLHRHYGLDVPAGTTPSYWLASITKQFTAAAILAFAETGEITLEDSLGMYLPEAPPDKRTITLLQLLTHTSGLPQAYAADGIHDRDEAARAILALDLARDAGSGFGYSNDNYTLLAMVLEIVSGARYETFLENYLFKAVGMRHTGFWGEPVEPGSWLPPLAGAITDGMAAANWGFRGAVGARASVEDLFRWTQALRRGRPLAPETVDLLLGPHLTLESGTGIGCGWFTSTREDGSQVRFTRGQEQYGANAVVYWFPELDITVIAATHAGPPETGSGPVTGWSRLVRDALVGILIDGD